MTYTELHAHSNFSFLDGASHIEELVLRARELGYEALALTDHDGLHGAMEFAQCARAWGLKPITGAEVTLAGGVCDIDPSLKALDHLGSPLRDKSRSFPKAEGFSARGGSAFGGNPQGCSYFLDDHKPAASGARAQPNSAAATRPGRSAT